MVVKVENSIFWRKPFKFFNFWMHHLDFELIIKQVWEAPSSGVPMFRFVSKLKALKGWLKQLNRISFANISERTSQAREVLNQTQVDLILDPTSEVLADLERVQHRSFLELRSQDESFFRQKARIRWLKEGDRNTKFFH